jgi:hypothetical protein
LLQFVDSKAAVADATMDEEEGFREVAEDVKRFEAKPFSPKYPPGTVSGKVVLFGPSTHIFLMTGHKHFSIIILYS